MTKPHDDIRSVFDNVYGGLPCTEFEIQAYLWAALRLRGYLVRGEVGFNDEKGKYRRADLVMVMDNCDLAIEVKAAGKPVNARQMARYRQGGQFMGVMTIVGPGHAEKLMRVIDGYTPEQLRDEVASRGATVLAAKAKIMPPRRCGRYYHRQRVPS